MRQGIIHVSKLAIAIAACAAGGQAASAQAAAEPAQPPAAAMDEIVVTAQFRSQNLQDTPIAITAVSSEMLEARSQTNIAQVTANAPNVSLNPTNANFGPGLAASIRGVGQYDFNPALEPGVGVYVDDVYYATLTGSIFDLLDVQRVEILRGPQGTLAGRNSIGGALKLYSQRPEGSNTGKVAAAYGSRDRIDLRASADIKLTDTLAMRIAGVSKTQEGYVKRLDFGCVNPPGSALNPAVGGVAPSRPIGTDCVLGREGEVNYQGIRAQLAWQATPDIEVNLIGDYTRDVRTIAGQVLTYASNANPLVRGDSPAVPFDSRFICGRFCSYATFYNPGVVGPDLTNNVTGAPGADGIPDYRFDEARRDGMSRFHGWGVSGQIDWRLGDDLNLSSITAYRAYDMSFSDDGDLSPLSLATSQSGIDFHFFSQELRLNGSLGSAIDYTVGGFYSDQRSTYMTAQDLRWAPPTGLQFSSLGDQVPADSFAFFAHGAWRATDALTVNLGIRYSEESKDYSYSRRSFDGTPGQPVVGPLDGVQGRYRGNRVDYRANVQYEWTGDIMTYAQFSTGFKGGGINPRPYVVQQVQPFGPETINAYELGAKLDLFDRKLRLNLAAFYNDYKDIQLTLLDCPAFDPPGYPPRGTPGVPAFPCALPANAGDAKVKGIEAEFTVRPAEGFLVDGSVSYLDFKYKRIATAAGGPGGVSLDMVAPYSPKWKWSIGAQYEADLGDVGSLTPRFDLSYQSSIFTNASNAPTNRISSYTLANGRLTWKNVDKDLEISAEVTNVFDKYYFVNVLDLANLSGYVDANPGRPREWALTVTKRF